MVFYISFSLSNFLHFFSALSSDSNTFCNTPEKHSLICQTVLFFLSCSMKERFSKSCFVQLSLFVRRVYRYSNVSVTPRYLARFFKENRFKSAAIFILAGGEKLLSWISSFYCDSVNYANLWRYPSTGDSSIYVIQSMHFWQILVAK